MVKLAQAGIVFRAAVIADNNPIHPLSHSAFQVLQIILEAFRQLFVRVPIKIVCILDVRQLVGGGHVRRDANEPNGLIGANDLIKLRAKRFLLLRIQVAETVFLAAFLLRRKVTPLDLALDLEKFFQPP